MEVRASSFEKAWGYSSVTACPFAPSPLPPCYITMTVPSQMKAIVAADDKTAKVAEGVAVPKPGKGEILVKVEAVTLNPTE